MAKLKINPKIIVIKGKRYAVIGKRRILIKDNDIGERELIKFLVKHLKPRRKQKTKSKGLLNTEPIKSSISYGSLNPVSLFDQIQKVKNDVNDKQLVQSKQAHGLNDETIAYLNEFVKRVNQNSGMPQQNDSANISSSSYSTPLKQKVHILYPPSSNKGIEYKPNFDSPLPNEPTSSAAANPPSSSSSSSKNVEIDDEVIDAMGEALDAKARKKRKAVYEADLKKLEEIQDDHNEKKLTMNTASGLALKNLATRYNVKPSVSKFRRSVQDVIDDTRTAIMKELNLIQEGSGVINDEYGLNTDQINALMSKYGNEYIGTIASDEMPSILSKVEPKSRGGFVINTQKHTQPGAHWQAVFYDARLNGSNSIEFYDSFGRDPTKAFMKEIKELANKLNAETYLKFKINKIIQQSNTSSNCGYFATKFLIDRFRGKPFRECTGFDEHVKDEKNINKWKAKQFKYLSSFQDGAGITDFLSNAYERVKAVIFGKTRPPPNVRKLINDHGKSTIKSIMVCRNPIESGLKSLINVISGNALEKAQQRLNYDNIYHLFLNITLDDGYAFTIERNQSVNIGQSTTKYEDKRDVNMGDSKIDLATFISKGAKSPNFWNYSTTNNCQLFCKTLLQSNGLYTKELNDFIMQDVDELFKESPLAQKIADGITNIAGRVDSLLNGAGKRKRKKI